MNFKTWSEQKKVKEQDLAFTRAIQEKQQLDLLMKISDQMALFQPSFSEGLSFLEQITDLILMGYQDKLLDNSFQFETWKQSVHGLRYPETLRRDEALKTQMETLSWPSGSKVRFQRRGDKSGVELKLFISSKTDLTKILAALE